MAYHQDSRAGRASDDDDANIGLISEQPQRTKRKEVCSKTLLVMLVILSNVFWIAAILRTWYGTKDLPERCGSNRYPADFGMYTTTR